MSDYLNVVYNKEIRPYTTYPQKLVRHLVSKYKMMPQSTFLELGCGRGEHLALFQQEGLNVTGMDLSPEASKFAPDLNIICTNLEEHGIPLPDTSVDIVYSKSVLEHFYYPEKIVKESYRVLKPGGLFVALVPDWESQYKTFYDDYTHRTPFTQQGLSDLLEIFNFQQVSVTFFRQLPSTWKWPILNYFCAAISPFIPVRTTIPYLRWSRELMLLAVAYKP